MTPYITSYIRERGNDPHLTYGVGNFVYVMAGCASFIEDQRTIMWKSVVKHHNSFRVWKVAMNDIQPGAMKLVL